MKLLRLGEVGKEKPCVTTGSGQNKDVSAYFTDWNYDFFTGDGLKKLSEIVIEKGDALPDAPADTRIGSCISRPGKIICVGLNYRDHAKEAKMDLPTEPVLFFKAPNTVVGPFDDVLIPRGSTKTDWEVELGVVIGKDARYLESPEEAANYIAGYCLCNDLSEREFQLERGGQWVKGKSCDTFNPIGPWLVTPDEIGDVNNLDLKLWKNGEIKQDSNTGQMAFDPLFLVHYISQFMTLEAGDLISTGTPAGVGLGFDPPQYLKEGDTVELEVTGLGRQRQVFRNA